MEKDAPITPIDPAHYRAKSIECIEVIRHWPGSLYAAGKYLWRNGLKDDERQELKKARWYVKDFINFPPPADWRAPLDPVEYHRQIMCLRDEFPPSISEILVRLFMGANSQVPELFTEALELLESLISELEISGLEGT